MSYIAFSAFFFSIDNIANMSDSDDSSSSEESINSPSEEKNDSLSPMKNGLTLRPDVMVNVSFSKLNVTTQFNLQL